ncbi:hypothetical protein ABZ807_33005 [Micromonospora sp. NPDC047548]|uniref:hypothetical protein n=1 Tax=Micromonospora sp. NPDC047548 TaxID=3155624 RepID=UPI0033F4F574
MQLDAVEDHPEEAIGHQSIRRISVGEQVDRVRRCGGTRLIHQALVLEMILKLLFRSGPRR